MSWEAPQALGGPVLAWEMVRGTRRNGGLYLRIGYVAWLVLQAVALFGAFVAAAPDALGFEQARSFLQACGAYLAMLAAYLDTYADLVLKFQLALVMAIVPALTAGSIGQEKERGTLFALFGTQLHARQIVLGKLLGRLTLVVPLILTPLPALVFMSAMADRALTPLLLALVQEAVLAFAVGAVCLLFAIWIRSAGDAILASYAVLGLAYLCIRSLAVSLPGGWLDPVESLQNILAGDLGGTWLMFVAHLAAWACVGAACLFLGCTRLRRVCVEQHDKKPSRRLWAFRPPVGDNPIRWRECHVIGLSPLPILRIVPRRFALLGVFLFSLVVVGLAAESAAHGFVSALLEFKIGTALSLLLAQKDKIHEEVPLLGLVFILLAELLIGVRCGTSVAEEKRRNTWDDLLLTAQSFREITQGKMWGVLQAIIPYVIAYAVPVFALAVFGGPRAWFAVGLWIVAPCAIVYGAALVGIDMLRVPPEMDETREGGAFAFENRAFTRENRRKRKPETNEGWGP